MFLATFAEAAIVGACDKIEDPAAPVWSRVVEMILVEVVNPAMTRPANPGLYNIPLLTFSPL